MKKLVSSFLMLVFLFSFSGCSNSALKYSFQRKKPNNFYYTNALLSQLKDKGFSNVLALEMNLQKEKNLGDADIETVKSFLGSIQAKNFLASCPDLSVQPQFRIYITSGSEKYVINVYNEKYIGIFPWDGSYNMDYLDMSEIKPLYNLYNLCKYLYR
ncbi:MAG: DUF4883 family protein [Bacillota bacterium]|nr:DUF4883 family protein [Bacillota bacterium]